MQPYSIPLGRATATPPASFVLGRGIVIGGVIIGYNPGEPTPIGTVGVLVPIRAHLDSLTVSTSHSFPSFSVRTYSSPGNIVHPSIEPNNRINPNEIDRSQIVPLRTKDNSELMNSLLKYQENGNSLDNLSIINRQIFARNVTSTISDKQSTRIVLKNLANNYGFKSSPNNKPPALKTIKRS
jgi:hypothetical protein